MLSISTEQVVLPNGLTLVVAPDRSVPVVAVNLWYGVGSKHERAGRTGFAHLFEHMMFQGSAHIPKNEHFERVERAGGSVNATTWFDRTNYFETLPAHHLELALWLESDRMGFLIDAIDQEKLDNQRDVVMNERRQRYDNQPYGDWDERMQAMVFPPEHAYHHTVIGSMEDIAAATLTDVQDFFRTYYRPNNAVLTLAGDVDTERAVALVERWFGGLPAGDPIPPVPGIEDPGSVIGGTVRERVHADVPLPRVYLGARIPAFADPDFYTADLATSILADGRASRLYRRLVRDEGIARDVVSFAFPLLHGRTFMLSWITGYRGADPEELEGALVREIEALAEVTEAELERAVALAETQLLRQVERLGSRADLLSMHQLYFGDAERLNSEVDRLRSVTPERVRAFAETHLAADNRAILTYLPEEDQ
ncbi:MAG: insulinase family protein [Gemmatimonadales bacterium]|nr:MAG: insulinase family protein [Gemmatimonadales bacterium]